MKKIILLSTFLLFIGLIGSRAGNIISGKKTGLKLEENTKEYFVLKSTIGKLTTRYVKTPEGTFVRLEIPGYTKSHNIGAPEMPVRNRLIEVPLGAVPKVIILNKKVTEYKLSDFDITLPVIPAQPPQPKSGINPPFVYDKELYRTDKFNQEPPVTVDVLGIMRSVQLGRVNIHPVQYNPVTNTLRVTEEMEFKVVFEHADFAATEALKERYYSPYFVSLYKSLLNYIPASTRSNLTQYPVKYAIVADRMFENQLAPFIQWKRRKGFTVVVAYTDSIGNNTAAIKAWLQSLYDAGTPDDPAPSFALFVGDIDQVAVWNNGNGVTDRNSCEFTGDLYPEMYYGRFSAQNTAQLQPYIDKTLQYEQYTMPVHTFLDTVVMIAGMDSGHGHDWGNGQINYGTINYFNEDHDIFSHTYLYPESGNHSADIIQNISDGVSYANYTAHGSPSGWADPSFTISDIPSLQNDGKYGLLIGNCCSTSEFQVSECFAEALLRAENKGALGYIGGSNSTYWDEDYYFGVGVGTISENPPPYEETTLGNYDRAWHDHGEEFGEWFTTMDQHVAAGNLAVTESGSSAESYYWDIYNLMGDPSLMVYYSVPETNPVTHDQFIMIGSGSFTVHAAPYSYVALNDNGVLKAAALADENGTATLNFTPFVTPGTAELVVTAQNYEPWIENIQVFAPNGPYCIYQNHTYDDDSTGNGNGNPDFDEEVLLSLTMANYGNDTAYNVAVKLSSADQYITFITDSAMYDTIGVNQTVTLNDAYEFQLADNVPDRYEINVDVLATDENDSSWQSNFTITAFAPDLKTTDLEVDDYASGNGNGRLDPGEDAVIRLKVINSGHCVANNALVSLIPFNAYVTVLSGDTLLPVVGTMGAYFPQYNVHVDENAPEGIFAEMHSEIVCGGYDIVNIFYPKVGILMEDWETGDFSKFDWHQDGNQPWQINNQYPYDGFYDAKSGAIQDEEHSDLYISYEVMENDSISFWRKVSSEDGYDFLKFYIDGTVVDQWSGTSQGWRYQSYAVTPGVHEFRWSYEKDFSASSGADCGWVDDIILPTMMMTTIFAGPDDEVCENSDYQCQGTATNFDTLYWATSGTGTFQNGNAFNAVYTPSEADISAGQVYLSFNQIDVDGNFASDTMLLTIDYLPAVPDMPRGPESVDLSQVTTSDYTVNAVAGAESYQWVIYPDSAGTITGTDTSATVEWNMDYEGEAFIKVAGINNCGSGDFSDSLLVVVSNPMGLIANSQENPITVWPNPNRGIFTIRFKPDETGRYSMRVVNQYGQTVLTGNYQMQNGTLVKRADLSRQPAGLYFVIVSGNNKSFLKKILVK